MMTCIQGKVEDKLKYKDSSDGRKINISHLWWILFLIKSKAEFHNHIDMS